MDNVSKTIDTICAYIDEVLSEKNSTHDAEEIGAIANLTKALAELVSANANS